jgi:GNAT superfamily N-acetyltransferase
MNGSPMNLSSELISQAIDQSWCDYFVLIKDFAAVEYYNGPEMLQFFSGLPHPFLNSIFRARASAQSADDLIEVGLDRARHYHLPLMWWVGPLTQPRDMGHRLEAHGFKFDDDETGMALDLDGLGEAAPEPTDLSITMVKNASELEDFLTVFNAGFEMEDYMVPFFRKVFLHLGFGKEKPLRHYVVKFEGKAVSCSSLFLMHGVAGIYNVSTLPEARRKGFGSLVTRRPLEESRAEGYHLAVLQASEMGVGVYHSLGFREYCRLDEYVYRFK